MIATNIDDNYILLQFVFGSANSKKQSQTILSYSVMRREALRAP